MCVACRQVFGCVACGQRARQSAWSSSAAAAAAGGNTAFRTAAQLGSALQAVSIVCTALIACKRPHSPASSWGCRLGSRNARRPAWCSSAVSRGFHKQRWRRSCPSLRRSRHERAVLGTGCFVGVSSQLVPGRDPFPARRAAIGSAVLPPPRPALPSSTAGPRPAHQTNCSA